MKTLLFIVMLALAAAAPTAAETPDECAARLDQDVSVHSITEATAWYKHVMSNCAGGQPEDPAIHRLTDDQPSVLTATDCYINVWPNPFDSILPYGVDLLLLPEIAEGSLRIYFTESGAHYYTLEIGARVDNFYIPAPPRRGYMLSMDC